MVSRIVLLVALCAVAQPALAKPKRVAPPKFVNLKPTFTITSERVERTDGESQRLRPVSYSATKSGPVEWRWRGKTMRMKMAF